MTTTPLEPTQKQLEGTAELPAQFIGTVWTNNKTGVLYSILTQGHSSETLAHCVGYRRTDGKGTIWFRSTEEFLQKFTRL